MLFILFNFLTFLALFIIVLFDSEDQQCIFHLLYFWLCCVVVLVGVHVGE